MKNKLVARLPKMREKVIIPFPVGMISEELLQSADQVVGTFSQEHSDDEGIFNFPRPNMLANNDAGGAWGEWLVKKGVYSGTWPRRYASLCWRKYGVRPPESLLVDLGNVLGKSATGESTHIVDFSNTCTWKPGAFGESTSSCWWGEYNGARLGLFKSGGLAMRFWNESNKGIGRCWIYPRDEALYIFNAYHNSGMNLYSMAVLLATHLGVSYRRVNIYVRHAYVNGEMGFRIAPVDVLENGKERYEFDFADDTSCECHCADCGSPIYEDDCSYGTYDGETICESCYEDHWFTCSHCGNVHHMDDERSVHGDLYCPRCFDRYYRVCVECDKAFDKDDVTVVNGDCYCTDCFDDTFTVCDKCGNPIPKDDMNDDPDGTTCDNCYKKEGGDK
jgi:formylmethanofuran dehydrogenase subunit E